jgi:hypothetical protein
MSSRVTEKVTLHFDLSHCPSDREFSLSPLGRKHTLTRHTPETFSRHSLANKALALIPETQRSRVTHFVEEVELPADAVGVHLVTYPNSDPNSIPELALAFIHIPIAAKRRHFRQKRKGSERKPHATSLTHFGISLNSHSPEEAAAVRLDATQAVTPFSTAEAIIFNHPDLLSTRADVASTVIYDHIAQTLHQDNTLTQYLSTHPPESSDPYYAIHTATNPQTGAPINPVTTDPDGKPIVDKDGKPIVWPQQNGQNVVQQYKLSPGVIGSSDGKQQGAAYSALAAVLQTVKNDRSLNGQLWSVRHGIASINRSNVQPQTPSLGTRATGQVLSPRSAADAGGGFQWNMSNKTSTYGLDKMSLTYDSVTSTLSFNVQNWANRSLGAYVQFFDETGPINDPWKDGHADKSKMYVTKLSAGNTWAGIPTHWDDPTPISFKVPSNATKADVLLGGMGIGNTDADVDVEGIVFTGLLNYAVPSFLIALSIGTTGARLALKTLEDMEVSLVIGVVKGFLGAPVVIIKALTDPKSLLTMFSEIALGLIFSPGLPWLAVKLGAYVTATEIFEKTPIVGWAFEVASCAAGIADMLATTVEVLSSPATYNIEAARVINLQVDVSPDPTHGAKPIWPLESDHWEMVVQYKGGTTVKKSGTMDSIKPDLLLSVLFSEDTAISAAPGAQIQVVANFYSASNWLCGKWSSAWVAAVAPEGSTTLKLQGSIIEFQVPLTAQTQYGHYQKLAYENGHHVWKRTTTAPTAVFKGSTDCPDTGNVLCRLVDISINDLAYSLGYTYQASGQGLRLDFGTDPQNGQMYAFQSISVLGNPEAGLKQPTVGFSLQPYIAYDQFGPAPLFTLPAATYPAELDGANGKPVPADLATAFANARGSSGSESGSQGTGNGNFTLPEGCVVKVVTASAEWYIGPTNKPLYDLRRETDTINVFLYPTPAFSPRNYYLDSRSYAKEQKYYLRQVALDDNSGTFNYTPGQSWGAFSGSTLDAIVVHPNGYVVGVNYEYHKMLILKLPAAAVDDADAPVALPMSGKGWREGLLQGPVALTVTPDGRILVLEQDNARIQALDTMANPVQCFAGPLAFTVDAKFKTDLNSNNLSTAFKQAYQQNVQPQLAASFSLPSTVADALNAGSVTADLKQQFANNALALSDSGPYQVLTTQAGSVWLLIDKGSGVTYDIRKNLYVNSGGKELLTLPATLIRDLNNAVASAALIHEFKEYGVTLSSVDKLQVVVATPDSDWFLLDSGPNPAVSYEITVQSNAYAYRGSTLLFSLPAGIVNKITGSGAPPQDIVDQFTGHGISLSSSLELNVITPGPAWQLVDKGNSVTYDINMEADLDVFHASSFSVEVISPNTHWVLRDSVNTLSFDIKPDAQNPAVLDVQQLVSVMVLKDGVSTDIHYLDVGVETKGFIYVLSYKGTGSLQSDYHLDIYSPDGTWLSRTPKNAGDPGINGARMIVDQWRNLYTLNYEAILGPNNRTEPSVSTWIPSTPTGQDRAV